MMTSARAYSPLGDGPAAPPPTMNPVPLLRNSLGRKRSILRTLGSSVLREQALLHNHMYALVPVNQFGDFDIACNADEHIGVVAAHLLLLD